MHDMKTTSSMAFSCLDRFVFFFISRQISFPVLTAASSIDLASGRVERDARASASSTIDREALLPQRGALYCARRRVDPCSPAGVAALAAAHGAAPPLGSQRGGCTTLHPGCTSLAPPKLSFCLQYRQEKSTSPIARSRGRVLLPRKAPPQARPHALLRARGRKLTGARARIPRAQQYQGGNHRYRQK